MGAVYQIRLGERAGGRARADAEGALRFRAPDGTFFVPAGELEQLRPQATFEVLREIEEDALPVRFLPPADGSAPGPPPEAARLAVLARMLAEERADGDVHVRFLGRHRTVPPDGFVLDRTGGGRRYVWQIVPSELVEEPQDVAERFGALRALLSAPDTRVALSMGSGGLKLFGHAPALRLLERVGCADLVDEVWGTSAGALVALLYCHGLSPESIEQTGYDLYGGRYRLALRPSTLHVLREILREALLPSRGSADAGFVDCARGLSHMLDQYCSEIRPVRPLYVVAFNLEEGRSEVLSPEPVAPHQEGLIVHTEARDATLASCAVPLLFVPHRIRRETGDVSYIDGSTTEDVPLRSVVEKWDRDRRAGQDQSQKLVILYVKLSARRAPCRATGRTGKLRLLQAVATAGMETIHSRDLEVLEARDDVHLIPFHLPEPDAEFFEITRIPEYIRRAKESFPLQLEAAEKALREAPPWKRSR